MSRKQIVIAAVLVVVVALGAIGYFVLRPAGKQAAAPESAPAATAQAPQPATPGSTSGTPDPVILVIDRNMVMQASKVGQDIARQIQAYTEQSKGALLAERQSIENEARQLQGATVSADDRQKRIAGLEAKQAQFQRDVQTKETQVRDALGGARVAVEKTLGPLIAQIVKDHGANIVLDKQAVPFASNSAFDITAEAVQQLDAKLSSYKVTFPGK